MDQLTANQFNKELAEKYGLFEGQPLFRLVWSTTRTEKRRTVAPYQSHGIDFGEVEAVREQLVYDYAPNRWVLEVLLGKDDLPSEFVDAKRIDYWPMWVFWNSKEMHSDGFFMPVEPTMEQIDMLVYFARNGTLRGHRKTEAQMLAEHEEFRAKQKAELREKLDNEIPELANALVHGSAVVVPDDITVPDELMKETK